MVGAGIPRRPPTASGASCLSGSHGRQVLTHEGSFDHQRGAGSSGGIALRSRTQEKSWRQLSGLLAPMAATVGVIEATKTSRTSCTTLLGRVEALRAWWPSPPSPSSCSSPVAPRKTKESNQ